MKPSRLNCTRASFGCRERPKACTAKHQRVLGFSGSRFSVLGSGYSPWDPGSLIFLLRAWRCLPGEEQREESRARSTRRTSLHEPKKRTHEKSFLSFFIVVSFFSCVLSCVFRCVAWGNAQDKKPFSRPTTAPRVFGLNQTAGPLFRVKSRVAALLRSRPKRRNAAKNRALPLTKAINYGAPNGGNMGRTGPPTVG